MLADYLTLNVDRFVRKTIERYQRLPSLRANLDALDGQKAVDTTRDKVQESPSYDNVHNIAMLRLKLEDEISDIEQDYQTLKKAMATLTDKEREAIVICYSGENIIAQCLERDIQERTIHNRRNSAIEKIEHALIG
jgi:DNA-directed RNA polymerase specialized sigma24 family protein